MTVGAGRDRRTPREVGKTRSVGCGFGGGGNGEPAKHIENEAPNGVQIVLERTNKLVKSFPAEPCRILMPNSCTPSHLNQDLQKKAYGSSLKNDVEKYGTHCPKGS